LETENIANVRIEGGVNVDIPSQYRGNSVSGTCSYNRKWQWAFNFQVLECSR